MTTASKVKAATAQSKAFSYDRSDAKAAKDKSTKQRAMRTGADKDQLGFSRLIDQKPIRRDVAFAVTNVITCQGMISVMLRQRLFRLQRAYYQSQLIKIAP
jgi:hypothetical protein